MRILITLYDIADLGGIVNHVEQLAAGFKELGHEVEFIKLTCASGRGLSRHTKMVEDEYQQSEIGTGLPYHQKKGWSGVRTFGQRTREERRAYQVFANEFDLVIHEVSVPPQSAAWKGETGWLAYYDLHPPQIGLIHDGNLQKLYPHIIHIPVDALVCVHHAALNSASVVPIRRTLIPNPQNVTEPPRIKWKERSGYYSGHTFKAWKHMDDLIRATALMFAPGPYYIAGGGIEYYYMTSKDKVKDKYLTPEGNHIWDEAVANGMEYLGYINPTRVMAYMRHARAVVDPSWSLSYARHGSHFNRVTVEAMINGAIPVARNLGMGTDETGNSPFFKADVNYVMIPHDATPAYFAEVMDWVLGMDKSEAEGFQQRNYGILDRFKRANVAQEYLDFAFDQTQGVIGSPTPEIVTAANAKMAFYDELLA